MPYGISKKLGGDSAKNDSKMERQVTAIMAHGIPKGHAIAIAKAAAKKRGHV